MYSSSPHHLHTTFQNLTFLLSICTKTIMQNPKTQNKNPLQKNVMGKFFSNLEFLGMVGSLNLKGSVRVGSLMSQK